MRKTYKYRLLGNKVAFSKAENWLNLCCRLYNAALEQRIMVYRQSHKYTSHYDQSMQLPELKNYLPEFKEINAQTLQDVLERLERAYQAFFKRGKESGRKKIGFPRFKGKDRYDSFTLKQSGWHLDNKYLTITKIGRFKLRLSRQIEGDIKTITIRRTRTNKWYACFSCDNVQECKLQKSDKVVGLDVGIKSLCVDSDGYKTENPLYLRQSKVMLRQKQRRLTRRIKGSNRRGDARLQVAKVYEKISNQRSDFLHKLANHYIKNYGVICIENLSIGNMECNHNLAESIQDSGWSEFFRLLSYKAEEAGRGIVKVRPHGTSQICSQCGEKVEKVLATRIHSCPYCGLVLDRDENAARNICRVGQTLQAKTKEVALCVA